MTCFGCPCCCVCLQLGYGCIVWVVVSPACNASCAIPCDYGDHVKDGVDGAPVIDRSALMCVRWALAQVVRRRCHRSHLCLRCTTTSPHPCTSWTRSMPHSVSQECVLRSLVRCLRSHLGSVGCRGGRRGDAEDPDSDVSNCCTAAGSQSCTRCLASLARLSTSAAKLQVAPLRGLCAADFKNVSIVGHYIKERTRNAQVRGAYGILALAVIYPQKVHVPSKGGLANRTVCTLWDSLAWCLLNDAMMPGLSALARSSSCYTGIMLRWYCGTDSTFPTISN